MAQLRLGQGQDVVARDAALREPQQHGAGSQTAAEPGPLQEAGALQRPDQPAGGRLGQSGDGRQLADGERLGRFHDANEQLGGAIRRLGSGLSDHS